MTSSTRSRWMLIFCGLLTIALTWACSSSDSSSTTGANTGATTGGSTGTATGSTNDSRLPEGEPVQDRVIIGIEYTGDEFNDTRWNQAASAWQVRPNYETLLTMNRETGEFQPQLATEWEIRDDTTLWFKLREGVQFHNDCGEMTAEDVEFSFWYATSLAGHAFSETGIVAEFVESVEVVDDYEVIVHLTKPDANAFLYLALDHFTYSQILCKNDWETRRNESVALLPVSEAPLAGTGSWVYVSRAPGSNIVFQRFEEHWRKVPDFKELEYRIINESSTRLAALLAGEIHMAALPNDLHETAMGRGMERLTGTVPGSRVMLDFICCGIVPETQEYVHPESPLVDLQVRKALNKAIDRDAINSAFLEGRGEVTIVSHFHETREGWDASWVERFEEEYGYDPEAARSLLNEAGFNDSNPLQLRLFIRANANFPVEGDVLETIAAYWQAVGVQVNLDPIDTASLTPLLDSLEVGNGLRLTFTTASASIGFDVYNANRRNWTRTNTPAAAGYTTVETTEMLIDALATTDPEVYAEKMGAIGEISFVEHMAVPLFWIPADVIVDPEVVADWVWPGSLAGAYTHTEYIEAVKQ